MKTHLILYVKDQQASTLFYSAALALPPTLFVPGMTEFSLGDQVVLGLMPIDGVRRLLGSTIPDPALAAGIPRAELYLLTSDPDNCHRRALAAGAHELSPMAPRDWGHRAAYSLDPDGHVLAFAEVMK
ncbi:MAG: glyoxalase [Deltaproteobacteria bacterium HGW-Deltaproteobacteria-22]|jgi:catechol 2,3-dioxygenase-like lactoylglutathione lyase family enzyme|nr:MAG: glyoxalase [Deltaproteobacteria bacterium HGW-Deltaproteobacteria-22]